MLSLAQRSKDSIFLFFSNALIYSLYESRGVPSELFQFSSSVFVSTKFAKHTAYSVSESLGLQAKV